VGVRKKRELDGRKRKKKKREGEKKKEKKEKKILKCTWV